MCFELGIGILNVPRKIFLVVYEPILELQGLVVVEFQGKKWPQTSPKLIVALDNMKKKEKNIDMTFWYLPGSM